MSFDIALTGLNAASTELEVVSNNIANSNTTGFKQARAEFGDIYAVNNLGVTQNAIGQGVRVTDVAQQFSQGDISFSDNNLDLAISGRGFFRFNDSGAVVFSRAGTLSVDQTGFIVNSAGQRLTGYQSDGEGNVTGALGDLFVDSSNQQPKPTELINLGVNLDSSEDIPAPFNVTAVGPDPTSFNHATSLTIFDSLGNSHIATTYYRKDAPNAWETFVFVDDVQVDGPDAITFNNDGSLNQINGVATSNYTSPTFNPGGGAADMTLTLSYESATQYGADFSVSQLDQNGYTTGRLSDVDFDTTGVLFARYTNGQSTPLGQVALANFANVQGLRPQGNTGWSESFESGAPLVGTAGSGSLGVIQSGAQENSNVDLTEELVSLITAQRNYQANAQVISTNDAITQTIINIR